MSCYEYIRNQLKESKLFSEEELNKAMSLVEKYSQEEIERMINAFDRFGVQSILDAVH